jgi:AcrR family transcriptional regulator
VTRRTPPHRLRDVAGAACSVFTEKGYRRALMTDVGAELGLSHAVLYRYVESKEALFELAMVYAMDPDNLAALRVPLPTPAPGHTLDLLRKWAEATDSSAVISRTLGCEPPEDASAEFTDILNEQYTLVSRHRCLLALVERSSLDLPDLHALFFGKIRRKALQRLADYLASRMSTGALRPATNIDLAARFIMEAISWFAWHRVRDADAAIIGEDEAHEAVCELLAATFLPLSAPPADVTGPGATAPRQSAGLFSGRHDQACPGPDPGARSVPSGPPCSGVVIQ